MEINKKTAGVSLIEVMISMVLIAILLMAVASVFPRMSSHRKAVQESDIAKDIATEVLEGLQMYSNIADDKSVCDANNYPPDFYENFIPTWFNAKKTIGATDYTVKWGACKNNTSFSVVDITVTWRKQGKPHTITVTGAVK
jgi:prepilin-type N-terminal cleavage/methylation domain-containing protein